MKTSLSLCFSMYPKLHEHLVFTCYSPTDDCGAANSLAPPFWQSRDAAESLVLGWAERFLKLISNFNGSTLIKFSLPGSIFKCVSAYLLKPIFYLGTVLF